MWIIATAFLTTTVAAQYPHLADSLWHGQQRTLRYRPDGTGFVITNGNRLFTRALYGSHTAFRVETGDRPEFALYLPGMGGNLKLGIGKNGKSKWLTGADTITARYHPGMMHYTIKDTILGKGKLELEVLALAGGEGLVAKIIATGLQEPVNLYWAYGGASGKKFSRDGDMGPDPESSFYLKPENCRNNLYQLPAANRFVLTYGAGVLGGGDGRYFAEDARIPAIAARVQQIQGVFPEATRLSIGDATAMGDPQTSFRSAPLQAPILTGTLSCGNDTARYFTLFNPAAQSGPPPADPARLFAAATAASNELAGRIVVQTPDPYINTVGGALSVAADAIWEAPTYLHGAVGWRMRLPGWRGPYAGDVLGWHDRARTHFNAYGASQVTTPIKGPVAPDSAMHLARSTEKLGKGMFSSGYISRDPNGQNLRAHHYDMNLVYVDALLRHFNWTGDTAYVRQCWPLIQRHLDWETRNFDADSNGLYDAYAAIWASDALQYSGGDVTHTSAYNYLAYRQAARIAALIGEDPQPYRQQAAKILHALNRILWMPEQGRFAEFRDALGKRALHPAAALWTVYHSIDSEVTDPFQAYQLMQYVQQHQPHIPVRAQGLDRTDYYSVATSRWMPYMWSLNNVALAESMHTALAGWQAGQQAYAFHLFKSEVLAAMYLGGSPGNLVQISHYDAVRGEAYRDFGDPTGMFARALVEGLFGIRPDGLNKKLLLQPGFPADWDSASIHTPDLTFKFERRGLQETYQVSPTLPFSGALELVLPARGTIRSVLLDGRLLSWQPDTTAIGTPRIRLIAPYQSTYTITISWQDSLDANRLTTQVAAVAGSSFTCRLPGLTLHRVYDPQQVGTALQTGKAALTGKIKAATGDYTLFAQVSKGGLRWWMPIAVKVRQPLSLLPQQTGEQNQHSFRVRNNTNTPLPVTVTVNSFRKQLLLQAGTTSPELSLPDSVLHAGTNKVSLLLPDGSRLHEELVNWNGTRKVQPEPLLLTSYFNDSVSQIFRNKYLSPRPLATTLQLPWQGYGDWPHPLDSFPVNDSGLRRQAGSKGLLQLPGGLLFRTPGEGGSKNICFTSQWDNYPRAVAVAVSGRASHAYFLLAGSTNPMQSQFTNGMIRITYTDGTTDSLVLRNPESWWPIDQDYYTDGFAFSLNKPRPYRIHLKTGVVVSGTDSKALYNGKKIEGGAATVLDMPLDPGKALKEIKLETVANDVVIGLMAITLDRNLH